MKHKYNVLKSKKWILHNTEKSNVGYIVVLITRLTCPILFYLISCQNHPDIFQMPQKKLFESSTLAITAV